MSQEDFTEAEPEEDVALGKRERSPSFPYIDLHTSIDLLNRLFRAAKMNEVRAADVAAAWNMAEKSGSFLRYLSALGQFGLMESINGGSQRKYKVSAAGRRILEDGRPGIREELCTEAALKPKIIRGLYLGEEEFPSWGRDRPSDSIAESALKFDLNFGGDAARRLIAVYDATIKYIKVSDAEERELVPTDEIVTEPDKTEQEPRTSAASGSVLKPAVSQAELGELNSIKFQSHGAGIISISATLNLEGLELLEKKIAAFKMLLD